MTPKLERLVNKYKSNEPYKLAEVETWPESYHVFDRRSLLAVDAARASGRPLLVRGEPGTGKSQLARAVAHPDLLNARFVSKVIDAQTDIEDLWFRYDAVQRLAVAQIAKDDSLADLEVGKFIIPEAMWLAYDFESAKAQSDVANSKLPEHLQQRAEAEKTETVLLLDEIDKADADLANSLLEVLGNGAFRVNMLQGKTVGGKTKPLVIFTSNDEKQLPPAFLRRCIVLNLALPTTEARFKDFLKERARKHHPDKTLSEEVLEEAASLLWKDRRAAEGLGLSRPGQAEYLDMIKVLVESEVEEQAQLELLDEVQDFVFRKHEALIPKTDTTDTETPDTEG